MFHEIPEQDWENYLNGEAIGDARRRVEAHLIVCPECRVMIERMKLVDGQFKRAIGAARRQVT
ncbi:MAG: zf-HC2 domain-containing protein, partial [Blastocatellia bacterium]